MMSDNDIIKALQCCNDGTCEYCTVKTDGFIGCQIKLRTLAVELINRKKAQIIKEQNKNSKLRNERNRLKAEVEALIAGQETLQKALAEKNAEIERKGKILNSYALQYGTVTDQSKKVKEIKSEAYKEFAEEFEKRCIAGGVYPAVTKNILKNLLKELTEGSNGE